MANQIISNTVQHALWSRPFILDCLSSVAASFAFPPCPFPPLINSIQILVYVNSYAPEAMPLIFSASVVASL